ncbi:TetR family transcriptional regulator, partial [Streptomyces sp. NPDC001274]
RYEQTLAGYLRDRYGDAEDGALRAEVVAASVVAAHNNGLRTWLRSGGEGDAEAAVDHALGMVRRVWGSGAGTGAPAGGVVGPAGDGEVVVMVAAKGAPMWRVVQQIEAAIG